MTIKGILRRMGSAVLPERVIARSKRVIFMTNLYLRMTKIYNPCNDTLVECNRRLGLVDNPNALKLPAVLQDKIWNADAEETFAKVNKDILCGDLTGVCQKVLAITPSWLQYGRKPDEMRHDIEVVASCVSQRRVVSA